ncbi:hypothetical protein FRC0418_00050 [Corynebacterium diphtheriae]|nr:hypothetical protein CIP101841_00377 [Corynebacterium diphtheriae]CAB0583760.1 hypothetical protein CIP107538_00257 [Corynebacterium diphtheriae]CAB0731390.1 hypothetical protein FRC0137_00178 [Corynebacterium diphtheriae]CAB0733826.1 hypothetical protein FRC0119_00295 [Corynebacterium diphtheriae]CAB0844570.1 hypothetical protein FRC0375_00230 [Corynebacterium diphtheriae]
MHTLQFYRTGVVRKFQKVKELPSTVILAEDVKGSTTGELLPNETSPP